MLSIQNHRIALLPHFTVGQPSRRAHPALTMATDTFESVKFGSHPVKSTDPASQPDSAAEYDRKLMNGIIQDLYANPKYVVYCEVGRGAPTSRSVHEWDPSRKFYQMEGDKTYLSGSHAEFIKIGQKFYVRDIGQSEEAKGQGIYYMDGASLNPRIEILSLKNDTPPGETSVLMSLMETHPPKIYQALSARMPFADRVFQPLKNGDSLLIGGRMLNIQGLKTAAEISGTVPTVIKTPEEGREALNEIREEISEIVPSVECMPDATKVMTRVLAKLRMLMDQTRLRGMVETLNRSYGCNLDEARTMVMDLHNHAKGIMSALWQQRDTVGDLSRQGCYLDPSTLNISL